MPNTKEQTRQLPKLTARALFQPETYDAANNTIEVVFATETPVLRSFWGEQWLEVLVCDDKSVRMERINQGAPVLDTHSTWSLQDQFGVVEKAWVDAASKVCRALVRLSTTEKDKEIVEKIKTGIIRNISVGYRVYAYEMDDPPDNKIPTMRCTDWEPAEISFVPVPADHNSGARSVDNTMNEVTIFQKSNKTEMPGSNPNAATVTERTAESTTTTASTATTATVQPVNEDQARKAGVEVERARAAGIRTAVRAVKLPEAFADGLIDKGTSLDEARALIIDELAKKETATPAVQAGVRVNADEDDKRRAAAIDGISLRSGLVKESDLKPEQVSAARRFRSVSLLELAKDSLSRARVDYEELSKMEIVARAFTSSSSDFPVLLEGTTRRVLLAAYAIAADTWRKWCAVGSVSDFREHKRLRLGSLSRLDKADENGEFKTKKISDAEAEGASIATFGNTINITRHMIVNDDLAGFTRLASMLGRAAARSIEIDVYKLLSDNPAMADGVTLFHANHGNLVSAAAMSVDVIDGMRVKMAQQKDKDSNDFLDIRPDILLCGIANGGTARVINDAQYDPDTANKLQRPNKVRGLFRDVVDTARITGTEYYAFADPGVEPVIEVNFLDGNQTPFMESRNGFSVDGVEWKVRHDYGVDAIGWRGAVKNPGA